MELFNGHVIFRGKSIVDGIRYSECIELLQWKKYGCWKEIPYRWNPLLFSTRSVLAVLLFLWVFPLGFRLTMAYSIQWLGEECSRYVVSNLHLTKAVEASLPQQHTASRTQKQQLLRTAQVQTSFVSRSFISGQMLTSYHRATLQ